MIMFPFTSCIFRSLSTSSKTQITTNPDAWRIFRERIAGDCIDDDSSLIRTADISTDPMNPSIIMIKIIEEEENLASDGRSITSCSIGPGGAEVRRKYSSFEYPPGLAQELERRRMSSLSTSSVGSRSGGVGAEIVTPDGPDRFQFQLPPHLEHSSLDASCLFQKELFAFEHEDCSLSENKCCVHKRKHFSMFNGAQRLGRRASHDLHVLCSSLIDAEAPAKIMLGKIHKWDFNIFTLANLTFGRPLALTMLKIFDHYNFISEFNLDPVKLYKCLSMIENLYHPSNHYHNANHGADVAQALYCFLLQPEISKFISPLEKMVALLAASSHDVDHPGVNQGFLIAANHHLAALYDNSILENHHWRTTISILQDSGVFAHLGAQKWEKIHSYIQSIILATDISRHQEFCSTFKKHMEAGFDLKSNEIHRLFLLQIVLKCADISNPCRPWLVSKEWSERVCLEFFMQGDQERRLRLAVTPSCDKETTSVSQIQLGFIQYIVKPLFECLRTFSNTPFLNQLIMHLKQNNSRWQSIADSSKKEDIARSNQNQFGKTKGLSTPRVRKVSLPHIQESEPLVTFTSFTTQVRSLPTSQSNQVVLLSTSIPRRHSFPDNPQLDEPQNERKDPTNSTSRHGRRESDPELLFRKNTYNKRRRISSIRTCLLNQATSDLINVLKNKPHGVGSREFGFASQNANFEKVVITEILPASSRAELSIPDLSGVSIESDCSRPLASNDPSTSASNLVSRTTITSGS